MPEEGPIVVGTDGSERAERAVTRAGELARAFGVPLHIVSAYRASADVGRLAAARGADAGGGAGSSRQDRTRAEHAVEKAKNRLMNAGVTADTHVWPGDPGEALLNIADEQRAQMIVVGNRGMNGARRMLGSVPNHVSHHARCSVMIVPTK